MSEHEITQASNLERWEIQEYPGNLGTFYLPFKKGYGFIDCDYLNVLEAEHDRYKGLFLSSQQSLTLVEQELKQAEAECHRLREALESCITVMERARHILQTSPEHAGNWGMLDTKYARAALDAAQKGPA